MAGNWNDKKPLETAQPMMTVDTKSIAMRNTYLSSVVYAEKALKIQ
jgi:hypothetical protein